VDAREQARKALADVQKGTDVAEVKQEERRGDTFGELAERYIAEYAKIKNKPGTLREKERVIKVDLKPAWGHRKAADITRREVIALLDEVAARGAPIHANRVLALVSSIFNWAVAKEIVPATPAVRLLKPGHEQSRDRVLEDEEVRKVWQALQPESSALASVFRLLLLTGQRRSEVREMRWSELDLKSGWWTIPSERTKNKLTHRVPLVGEALGILKSLEAGKGDTDYVFVGKGGILPVQNLAKPLKRVIKRSGVSFRVHDLRRTLSTNLGRLRVDEDLISKVLNHFDKKNVTGIYNRYRYDREKRMALVKWDRGLRELLTGRSESAKVVAIAP
jgi:integrase